MWFDGPVFNPPGVSFPQRLNGKVYRLALVLTAVYFVLTSFRPMLDNVDLGWHVAQGRWMVEHGAVYRQDVLNYPNLGRPVVDEYPLFQVALYFAWKLGWWGPCLLAAVGYLLLIGTLAWAAALFRLEGSALLVVTWMALILYLQLAFPLRPHLATYLGVALLGVFLLRHREAGSWLEFWPMALGQIAWTNSHSGFILGPLMTALFGLEMTVRHSLAQRGIAWKTARVWAGAFLLILLACFVNPFGVARFYPPFYQDQLESIRAYVGEMQPLSGGTAARYGVITLIVAAAVALATLLRRGAISYSLLFLAALLCLESLAVKKSWPVFGLFPPLLVLSSAAFASARAERRLPGWPSLFGNFLLTSLIALGVIARLDGSSETSLQATWRDHDLGRTEISFQAIAWMKAQGLDGRLLHRCEDGGHVQEAGYDRGQACGDTGFGKFGEAFIHDLGLLGERPALLPHYVAAYQPAYVICGTFCYAWPYYLRQLGWRVIFYSPNSSVWTRAETRSDLPTIADGKIQAAFLQDIARNGRPADPSLYGRDLLTLNSMGLEDFAFAQLTALPAGIHHASWYWEAARILCFETPPFSAAHRNQLFEEASRLHDDAVTAEFRAYVLDANGDADGARRILEALPARALGSHAGDLLLKIDLEQNRPEALARAERLDGFDLRDGQHWAYVAEAEARAGHASQAAQAWEKAVFYYPDDSGLMRQAAQFAAQAHDAELDRAIASAPKP